MLSNGVTSYIEVADLPRYFEEAPKMAPYLCYSKSEIEAIKNNPVFVEEHLLNV